MAKLALTPTAAGYAYVTTMNANNDLIEAAMENTLSRDGTTPNTMSVALDMNSQLVNNIGVPVSDQDAASKKYVDDIVTGFTSSATFSAALPYTVTGAWDFEALVDLEAGFRVWEVVGGSGDSLTMTLDGTDANWTYSPAVTSINFTGASYLDLTGGMDLRCWDNTDADYMRIYHDGTDGIIDAFATTSKIVLSTEKGVKIDGGSNGSGLFIDEIAAGLDDITGFGQVWVKNNAPNDLYFTDDTGRDVQITDNGALAVGTRSVRAVKSANEGQTTDSTITADADLIVTVPTVDKMYKFEAFLYLSMVSATPDFKHAWVSSQTLQIGRVNYSMIDSAGTNNSDNVAMNATTTIALAAGAPNVIGIHFTGVYQPHATVSSTLGLSWSQGTSDASPTTLLKGSWMELTQLD